MFDPEATGASRLGHCLGLFLALIKKPHAPGSVRWCAATIISGATIYSKADYSARIFPGNRTSRFPPQRLIAPLTGRPSIHVKDLAALARIVFRILTRELTTRSRFLAFIVGGGTFEFSPVSVFRPARCEVNSPHEDMIFRGLRRVLIFFLPPTSRKESVQRLRSAKVILYGGVARQALVELVKRSIFLDPGCVGDVSEKSVLWRRGRLVNPFRQTSLSWGLIVSFLVGGMCDPSRGWTY